MEDYKIDIRLSEGPKAQTISMPIEPFTLIGATTRLGMLTAPMHARFGIEQRLNFYPADDLELIVHRTAEVMKVGIEPDGAAEIARRARGTPRVANRLLRRVRDYAQVKGNGVITKAIAEQALALLDVDAFGLDDMDARILKNDHREVRRRSGRPEHDRRGDRRGREHDRGSVRAVPRAARLSPAHAARPRRDGAGVSSFRLHAADAGRTGVAVVAGTK